MSTAAFILGVLSLGLASVSIGWQAATFKLTGAVVKVKMKHGAVGPGGAMLSEPGKANLALMAAQDYTLEVFAVEVINTGRMATRVTRVEADLSKVSFAPIGGVLNPKLPHVLDAQSTETFYIEASDVRRGALTAGAVLTDAPTLPLRIVVSLGNGKQVVTTERATLPART